MLIDVNMRLFILRIRFVGRLLMWLLDLFVLRWNLLL